MSSLRPGAITHVLKSHPIPENLSAPALSASNKIIVSDTPTIITTAMISVHDADTSDDQIHIHVIRAPRNGDIMKVAGDNEDVMSARDSFTMQDIVDGRIVFGSKEDQELAG